MHSTAEAIDERSQDDHGASPRRQVRLPAELSQRLDDYADQQGRTASAVMREAITSFLDHRMPARPAIKYLTNQGACHDTWSAWRFYRRVRSQFADWNHVILTFGNDERIRASEPPERKLVVLADDAGNLLVLEGVNFGYNGGAPTELAEALVSEGFDRSRVEYVVLNPAGSQCYPITLSRD